MKWIFSLLIVMGGSVAFAGETGLQESAPTPSETATVARSANEVLNVLAKRLSLTEEQKSKILHATGRGLVGIAAGVWALTRCGQGIDPHPSIFAP